jgi:hypothetical protein
MVYTRKPTRWIEPADRRELWDAERFARVSLKKPLNWLLTFHPAYLHQAPEIPLADLFKDARRRTATRLDRRKIDFYGTWSRENYAGDNREHLHIALYLPDEDAAADLEAGWRSWYPGENSDEHKVVLITNPGRILDPRTGQWMSRAVAYSAKQMTPAAAYHPDPKRHYHRESENKWGEPVAPVLGQKCGVTRTLDVTARSLWRPTRPASRQSAIRGKAVSKTGSDRKVAA